MLKERNIKSNATDLEMGLQWLKDQDYQNLMLLMFDTSKCLLCRHLNGTLRTKAVSQKEYHTNFPK